MRVANQLDHVHEILGIKVVPGHEKELLKRLRTTPEVAAAYISLGEFDIIAFLDIEDLGKLNYFVSENMGDTTCVRDMRTILVRNGGTQFKTGT